MEHDVLLEMKNISKITMAVSKTVEILHWAGAVFSAALLVCSFAAKDWLFDVVSKLIPEYGNEVSTYGFEMTAVDENGLLDMTVIRLFAIGSVIILSLMAMVFRNVYLVVKKSENDPFNKDNIRMIREIGIFSLSVPVIGFIMSVISRIVIGVEKAEIVVRIDGLILGILILFITQIFVYGAELQNDVDGLL